VDVARGRAAFARWTFRPRVLCDVSEISTATTVLGRQIELPVVVAPVAYQQLYDPQAECATARGAAAAGTGIAVSTFSTRSHEEIAAAAPGIVQWCQLYVFQDRSATRDHLAEAAATGCSAIVLTVDTPRLAQRERDLRVGFEIPSDLPLPYARAHRGRTTEPGRPVRAARRPVRGVISVIASEAAPVALKGSSPPRTRSSQSARRGGGRRSNHGGRQLTASRRSTRCRRWPSAHRTRRGLSTAASGAAPTSPRRSRSALRGAPAARRSPPCPQRARRESARPRLLRDGLTLALCALAATRRDELTPARPTLARVDGRLHHDARAQLLLPLIADQLRSGRRRPRSDSATTGKYKKGMVIRVLAARFSPREHGLDDDRQGRGEDARRTVTA
jgi:hypothetical protein